MSATIIPLRSNKFPAVRIPRSVRDSVSVLAVATYAVLVLLDRNDDGKVQCKQSQIQHALGSDGKPERLRKALRELADAGHIRREQAQCHEATLYTLVTTAGENTRYDSAPLQLMDLVQRGELPPRIIWGWLHLDHAMGAGGWTREATAPPRPHRAPKDTAAPISPLAQRMGVSQRTLERAIADLATHQLITAQKGLIQRGAERVRDKNEGSCATKTRDRARQKRGIVRDKNEGTYRNTSPEKASSPETAPTAETALPSVRSTASSPSITRRTVTSGKPKNPGISQRKRNPPIAAAQRRQDVMGLVTLMPPDLFDRDARRWLPGITTQIARWLDAGTDPDVILLASDIADLDAYGGAHLPALRRAMTTIEREIRQGLHPPCRVCASLRCGPMCFNGSSSEAADNEPVTALPPLPQRLRAYRGLSMRLGEIQAADPAAVALVVAKGLESRQATPSASSAGMLTMTNHHQTYSKYVCDLRQKRLSA